MTTFLSTATHLAPIALAAIGILLAAAYWTAPHLYSAIREQHAADEQAADEASGDEWARILAATDAPIFAELSAERVRDDLGRWNEISSGQRGAFDWPVGGASA